MEQALSNFMLDGYDRMDIRNFLHYCLGNAMFGTDQLLNLKMINLKLNLMKNQIKNF